MAKELLPKRSAWIRSLLTTSPVQWEINTSVHNVMTSVRKGQQNSAVRYTLIERLVMGLHGSSHTCHPLQSKSMCCTRKSYEEKRILGIKNVHIQKNHSFAADELEVIISSSTKIDTSEVETDIRVLPPIQVKNYMLSYWHVLIRRWTSCQSHLHLRHGRRMAGPPLSQITIAWCLGRSRLKTQQGQSYSFTAATVKLYADKTFFSHSDTLIYITIGIYAWSGTRGTRGIETVLHRIWDVLIIVT